MKRVGVRPVGGGPEEALAHLAGRYGLATATATRLEALLAALAREPRPETKISAPAEAVDAHIADSLVALELPEVRGARRIADVGSGAGFPGLPLAIALPEASVDLIESNARKCQLIERLADAGRATNARAVALRVEAWAAGEGRDAYDLVTARAVASLAVLAEYAAPLLRPGGSLVAWKGRRDAEEERAGSVAAERLGLSLVAVRSVTPFPEARDRNLHLLQKRQPTPPGFPRRPGRAVKRPLA